MKSSGHGGDGEKREEEFHLGEVLDRVRLKKEGGPESAIRNEITS
jgi:hypothetical protein